MFPNLTDRTKAAIFYALAFSFSAGLVLLAPVLGEQTPVVAMFTSLLAVLLMLLVVTRDGYTRAGWAILGVHRAGFGTWGLALVVPFLVLGFGYSVAWLTGVAMFTLPANFNLATFLPDRIVFIVIAIVFAAVEEIGWRGYLLPHLSSLGPTRALLLSGLLHGIWHLPILLLTPYYHSDGNPLIVATLFLAALTLSGVTYGYLRLTTDSMWPAAIAHGVYNGLWGIFGALSVAASPVMLEYLAGETGVLPLIGLAITAIWLLRRLDQGQATKVQMASRVEVKA